MVFKDYGRHPSIVDRRLCLFLASTVWCPTIIWYCHMVIILMMTEWVCHSGAITFERATDGLWRTYMSRYSMLYNGLEGQHC